MRAVFFILRWESGETAAHHEALLKRVLLPALLERRAREMCKKLESARPLARKRQKIGEEDGKTRRKCDSRTAAAAAAAERRSQACNHNHHFGWQTRVALALRSRTSQSFIAKIQHKNTQLSFSLSLRLANQLRMQLDSSSKPRTTAELPHSYLSARFRFRDHHQLIYPFARRCQILTSLDNSARSDLTCRAQVKLQCPRY